jgi:GPI-GlcNAc transferase complex, PIG-H component
LTKTTTSHRTTHRFIDEKELKSVLLNEGIPMNAALFYLMFELNNSSSFVLALEVRIIFCVDRRDQYIILTHVYIAFSSEIESIETDKCGNEKLSLVP